MRLVRTETGDFTDAELEATKHRYGQLYADVSTKLAPDDFARDLRKLVPSRECLVCPDRDGCARCWEAVPEDVFTRDDRRLGAILATLTGRVLDVGGGEGSHLGPLVARAHLLEYTCVEPDRTRVAVLAARWPSSSPARFVVGVGEDIGPELGSFDHALFVRSYNHLEGPERAITRALALLAPGGSLLLVDNVAFGLVRSRAHAARAEAAPGNLLEHHRNDDAEAALAVALRAARAAGRTLSVVERHDVGPDTSNQWILRLVQE